MRPTLLLAVLLALSGCATTKDAEPVSWYGTLEPFASEAVYFVVTDRFVNGDPGNDHRDQGGKNRTFDIPLTCPDGTVDNIGYLGGDFRGLLDHADYIRDMGFTAVWITPIVDNPDEAFTGGDTITCSSFLTDRGKAGYHGYWSKNFYRVDEHLESPGLAFKDLTRGLHDKQLKVVLDIVANHTSPAFTMPTAQPDFGQLYDASGNKIADHQNLAPDALDPVNNPLHRFYNNKKDLAQLGDLNGDSPGVRDHLANAYLQWIAQGADAFRIDTIRHQPFSYWQDFTQRIRTQHPGFFMFGEAFDSKAENIAPFTWPQNGGVSVLDFPLKDALLGVFEKSNRDFSTLEKALYLTDGPYQNPYELTTFYDNHDMKRMDASDSGFINANNWLFTARGIPVIYYGSEIGFMRGRVEHHGNRNYFGVERIAAAKEHAIQQNLARIAKVRRDSIALQRGLQLNERLEGDEAVFYRVYQHAGVSQTALVMLNKSDSERTISARRHLPKGEWKDAFSGSLIDTADTTLSAVVPPHGVRVFLTSDVPNDADSVSALRRLMKNKTSRR